MLNRERCFQDERSIKFTGNANGREFFAKVLIADPYPVGSGVPWQEVLSRTERNRPVEKQVKLEAFVRSELAFAMDVAAIPVCLGASTADRAIVWERVRGTSALKVLRLSRLVDPLGSSCRAIALQAGRWLRRLHDATAQGSEELKVSGVISQLLCEVTQVDGSALAMRATEMLRRCKNELPPSLRVQVSQKHGDFTLVNLLWDQSTRRLYVTDFEDSDRAGIWQDLASIIFSLRKQLFNPLVPESVVRNMERSFWTGYGAVEPELFKFVQTLTVSKLLMHRPKSFSTSATWAMDAAACLYRSLVQPKLISRAVSDLSS